MIFVVIFKMQHYALCVISSFISDLLENMTKFQRLIILPWKTPQSDRSIHLNLKLITVSDKKMYNKNAFQ